MLEVGRRLDLGQEALSTDDCSQLRFEDLESDSTIVLDVLGEVDGGHTAFTQLTLDSVSALQSGFEAIHGGVGHWRCFVVWGRVAGLGMASKMGDSHARLQGVAEPFPSPFQAIGKSVSSRH